jgi:hypothetical protein
MNHHLWTGLLGNENSPQKSATGARRVKGRTLVTDRGGIYDWRRLLLFQLESRQPHHKHGGNASAQCRQESLLPVFEGRSKKGIGST